MGTGPTPSAPGARPGSARVTEVDEGATPDLEWLRLAMDAMPTGVVVVDEHGRIVAANVAAQALYRLPSDEFLDRSTDDDRWQVVRRDGTPMAPEDFPAARCLATGEHVSDEVVGVVDGEGELRWNRVTARPLEEGGRVTGAVVVLEDASDTIRVQQDLHRSEQQLARAREAAGVALWEWELATGELILDDHFETITGYPLTASQRAWLERVHPDDAPMVKSAFDAIFQGQSVAFTYRLQLLDGTWRWLRCRGEAVDADDTGTPTHIAGSVLDVTPLKATTDELRSLLDAMVDGYVSLDRDWRYRFANRQALERLGRTDLTGARLWDEWPGLEDVLGEAIRPAMEGEAVEVEVFYDHLDAWFEIRAYPVGDGIGICFRDVTRRRQAAEERERLLAETAAAEGRLAHAALHDDLTGLPNRTALLDWLHAHLSGEGAAAVDRAGGGEAGSGGRRDRRDVHQPIGLIYLDLDRFKLVNDTYGHPVGDALLVEAAARLRTLVRPQELVVRLGGDELVVAVPRTDATTLTAMAERVLHAFREPFTVGRRRLVATTSIGLALSEPGASAESLLRDADTALYRAKDAGRDQVAAYDTSLRRAAWQRLATESDLRESLAHHRTAISAHYQPSYDLNGNVVGAEALARWTHPERGSIPPSEFIPVAEETGLVVDLGWHMFGLAAEHLERLAGTFTVPDSRVWVNVAARQLDEPSFADELLAWLDAQQLTARIGLEITERDLARDVPTAEAAIRRLAAEGVAIAIDDFGTGYSSLARLAHLPIDMVKIDRSFVAGLATDTGRGIVGSVIALAHSIGAQACAEGVETPEELRILTHLGVDGLSGYHLCPPVPISRFVERTQRGVEVLAAGWPSADDDLDAERGDDVERGS